MRNSDIGLSAEELMELAAALAYNHEADYATASPLVRNEYFINQTDAPVPATGISCCCQGIGATSDAYVAPAEKSKKVRNGLPAEERPCTDSLHFGKV